jgi:hypothetical protein
MPKKLKTYHFDVGDSSEGPVGFCARVYATSKKEALAILKDVVSSNNDVELTHNLISSQQQSVEYLNVYLNADAITLADIDEVDDAD